jgi:NAD-dependent SIR2 family protein deacetylase
MTEEYISAVDAADWKGIITYMQKSAALVFLTGAGMGADAGLPIYSGNQDSENNPSVLLSPAHLARNPVAHWQATARMYAAFENHQPHEGYYILQRIADYLNLPAFVLTSTVDGYWQRAGFPAEKIREIHGRYALLQCSIPCSPLTWAPKFKPAELLADLRIETVPRCPHCGAVARPNVYMFSDDCYISRVSDKQKTAYENFLNQFKGRRIFAIEIGAGPHVRSIRLKSRELIGKYFTTLLRINPKDHEVREGHFSIAAGALAGLQLLESKLTGKNIEIKKTVFQFTG